MSHTPEPWHVFNHSWSDTSVLADGFDHAICCLDINHATEESQEKDAELMEANARRIVACVNWCKGNSTEGMERAVEIGRPYAVERDDAYGRELEITKQRDELLAGRLVEEPLRRQIAELREKVDAGGPAIWQQPLQKLGARLAELLDEDQFAECEALLLAAGVKPYNAEVTGRASAACEGPR